MYTLFMMVLSSLVTLYFTKPGFRKRVNAFFDWSDDKQDKQDLPVLEIPTPPDVASKGPSKAWMEWNDEDQERIDGVQK